MTYTCETCGKEPARSGSGSCDRCIRVCGEGLECEYKTRERAREIEAAKKEKEGVEI